MVPESMIFRFICKNNIPAYLWGPGRLQRNDHPSFVLEKEIEVVQK